MNKSKNIIMIGMPASGKSTIGKLIAQELNQEFFDVDLLLEKIEGMPLQEIINTKGNEYFRELEGRVLSELDLKNTVISPGGSAIYYHEAMLHLKEIGQVVYLDVPFEIIEKRLHNMGSRGITLKQGQSLKDLYDERKPLYEKYADISVSIQSMNIEDTVQKVLLKLA